MSLVPKVSLHNLHRNAAQLTPRTYKQFMQGSKSRRSHKRCSTSTPPMSPLWSSDEPLECSMQAPLTHSWRRKILVTINESTKWTVSATVLAVLLWQHNEYAAWCVIGAVLSSFLCKVLKHMLNHERPDKAPKSDPGMPSSHANSGFFFVKAAPYHLLSVFGSGAAARRLNFLSVYAALSLIHHTHSSAGAQLLAGAVLTLGIFKTWLRGHLGFHTWPQVLVGAGLGAASAITWFKLGTAWALPSLQQSAGGLAAIYILTGLGSAVFAWKMVSGWLRAQHNKAHVHEQGDDGHTPAGVANGEKQAQLVKQHGQGGQGVGLQQVLSDQEGTPLVMHAYGGECTAVAAT